MPRFDPWPGEFPIEVWDPEFRQRVSPDGKTYSNVQEEPVRQWAAIQLVRRFGVPHRQIKFEEPVKYQHERKSARQCFCQAKTRPFVGRKQGHFEHLV
jgi:hypothetical protein